VSGFKAKLYCYTFCFTALINLTFVTFITPLANNNVSIIHPSVHQITAGHLGFVNCLGVGKGWMNMCWF